MCEICGKTPCDSKCPNSFFSDISGVCDVCLNPIYSTNEYYVSLYDGGEKKYFCSLDCVFNHFRIKLGDDSECYGEVTSECFRSGCKYLDDDDGGHICRR